MSCYQSNSACETECYAQQARRLYYPSVNTPGYGGVYPILWKKHPPLIPAYPATTRICAEKNRFSDLHNTETARLADNYVPSLRPDVMRVCLIILLFSGWSATSFAATSGDSYHRLLVKTGLTRMLTEFPAEIHLAANRHAERCSSTAAAIPITDALTRTLTERLRRKADEDEVQSLVDWFVSLTGRKVRKLELLPIDEQELKQHTADPQRLAMIQKIYHNTDTGKFIASVAVEIEYAGWRLSGCMQSAANSGDLKKLKRETTRAQIIRGEAETLLALFEEDTVRTMEFALSSLSDDQLAEYYQATKRHAGVFTTLIDALLYAIDTEAGRIRVSASAEH